MSSNILRTLEALSALKLNCEQQQRRCSARVESASSYLQQQDEIVHRVVPCVQVVTRAQTVVGVKVHFLVDARVTEQVEQDLLGDASGAEVLHLCRGSKVRDTGIESTGRLGNDVTQQIMSRRSTRITSKKFDLSL